MYIFFLYSMHMVSTQAFVNVLAISERSIKSHFSSSKTTLDS